MFALFWLGTKKRPARCTKLALWAGPRMGLIKLVLLYATLPCISAKRLFLCLGVRNGK